MSTRIPDSSLRTMLRLTRFLEIAVDADRVDLFDVGHQRRGGLAVEGVVTACSRRLEVRVACLHMSEVDHDMISVQVGEIGYVAPGASILIGPADRVVLAIPQQSGRALVSGTR